MPEDEKPAHRHTPISIRSIQTVEMGSLTRHLKFSILEFQPGMIHISAVRDEGDGSNQHVLAAGCFTLQELQSAVYRLQDIIDSNKNKEPSL